MVSPDTRAFCFQQMRKPSPERIRTSLKYLPFTKQKHVCEVGISVLPFFFAIFFPGLYLYHMLISAVHFGVVTLTHIQTQNITACKTTVGQRIKASA